MKLIDFLKLYDPCDNVRIYDAGMYNDGHISEDDEDHCVYEGAAFDTPWVYAHMPIFNPKEKGYDWYPIGIENVEGKIYTAIWITSGDLPRTYIFNNICTD